MERNSDFIFASLGLFVVFAITVLIWIIGSSLEASSYNKLTGNNVSTWDAMWIELRVQDAPQNNK